MDSQRNILGDLSLSSSSSSSSGDGKHQDPTGSLRLPPRAKEKHSDFSPPPSHVLRSPSRPIVTKSASSGGAPTAEGAEDITNTEHMTPSRSNVSHAALTLSSSRSLPGHLQKPNHPRAAPAPAHNHPTMYDSSSVNSFGTDLDSSNFLWSGPLGSFGGNDTPPRMGSARASPRDSPRGSPRASPRASPQGGYQHHHQHLQYPSYPPPFSAPVAYNPNPHGYRPYLPYATMPLTRGRTMPPYQHPGYSVLGSGPTPPHPFYEPPDHGIWNSPPPIGDSFGPSSLNVSPFRARDLSLDSLTPEKPPKANPFRSPPSRMGFNRSPLQGSTPLGAGGSFGMMNSPDAQLKDAFSPVGPAYVYFEPGTDAAQSKISFSRSNSGDQFEMTSMLQPPNQSPFSGFISEFSSLPSSGNLQGVSRSPMEKGGDQSGNRGPPMAKAAHSSSKPPSLSRQLRASPVAPSSEVKPTVLWQDPRATPRSALRLTLTGSQSQRSLEGINSMMRAQQAPSSKDRRSTPASRGPYDHVPLQHHQPKQPPPPQQQQQQQQARYVPPQPVYRQGTPNAPTHPPASYAPPLPVLRSASKPPLPFPPSSASKKSAEKKEAPPKTIAGKENSRKPASNPQKRTHCNCRKSKCLKLYCECFSARIYCDGCKCLECRNIPTYESLRDKAIKDARSKNPRAFEVQASGCRCKRSECLKKYCECFQAGDFCSASCKCISCENRPGSQKLIDKRRKMKDTKGAEFAMRIAQETWKGRGQQSVAPSPRVPMPSPASSVRPPGPGSASRGHPHPSHVYMHSAYNMGPPMMGHIGYSPLGASAVTPSFPAPRMERPVAPRQPFKKAEKPPVTATAQGTKRVAEEITPPPKARGVRKEFDPATSRKKRKVGSSKDEETSAYFGTVVAKQPKTTALAVLSFLANDDLYKAALVSKSWSRLAMDEELWKFN